jgi:hypothetical protein
VLLAEDRTHILFMDADNATKIEAWDEFETRFREGFPAVIASRHLPDSQILFPQPWLRRFLGAGYRVLCRGLFDIHASDFNCGFKAYETPLAKKIYSQNRRVDWTFDIEVFCRMKKQAVRFAEVPVRWAHQEKRAAFAPFQTVWKTFRSLWLLKRDFS